MTGTPDPLRLVAHLAELLIAELLAVTDRTYQPTATRRRSANAWAREQRTALRAIVRTHTAEQETRS